MERLTWLVLAILVLDTLLGDPVYRLHPIRLMGNALAAIEGFLFRRGWNGYGGGIALFLLLCLLFPIPVWIGGQLLEPWPIAHFLFDLYWGFHCLALRDLATHGLRIGKAVQANDVDQARYHCSMLVGRDTAPMDGAACCRAGLESMGENLVDGVLSPLFWLLVAGIPGMVLFKVASTMDSMVGYKSERYLRFGWCGARSDDLLNYIPARIAWLAISMTAALLPGFRGMAALVTGWQQHALLPGPNAGWGETTFAGALYRRLAGPIWKNGVLVNELWIGPPAAPCTSGPADLRQGVILMTGVTWLCVLCGLLLRGVALQAFPYYN